MPYIDRPPRIQPELPVGEVEIPPPPREEENAQPMWQAAVPIITILGYVLVSATGRGSNITFLIPMALAVVASSGVAVYNTVRSWRIRRQKREAYARRLVEMRREMAATHNRQRNFYEYNYPDPEVVLEIDGTRQDNRGGSRLWERRANDDDFGLVRIGVGNRESTVLYKLSRVEENDENPQMQEAERLQKDSQYVADAPITLPLYKKQEEEKKSPEEEKEASIRHTIGISGDENSVYEFIYSVITNFCVFHSPLDTQVFVLGLNEAAPQWEWAYDLPHCTLDRKRRETRIYFEDIEMIRAPVSGVIREMEVQVGTVLEKPHQIVAVLETKDGRTVQVPARFVGRVDGVPVSVNTPVEKGDLLARIKAFELSKQQLAEEMRKKDLQQKRRKERKRETAGVPRFWKEKIWSELDRRARRIRDRDEGDTTNQALPFMLVVVDLLASNPGAPNDPLKNSWLEEMESEAAISLILSQGQQLGASVIYLVPERSKIPSGCEAVIELKNDAVGNVKFLYAETGLNTTRYVGTADTIRNVIKLSRFATTIADWDIRRSYGADIPRAVGLLPLYDAETITQLSMREKWDESKEAERADWPKIPLGMLAGQEPRELHFFADADGVHGMIAGSTGSGKSELLMTMILSLAIKYDPSVVNFLLVDYKGGAAFDPFDGLPHVVDIVTNLGQNAVARMFAAINAELNRRQNINQMTDNKDIVRYRRNGEHIKRRDNYPHLFIIIDEFAEMIANNPEYKAQLDSITRLGRALGVSLILAAQRPTGVTDQMRANIKFRICLRVETKEESNELLRLPDASYLPSIPGRGYLQVGSESLENIQISYTGMAYNDAPDYDPLERYLHADVIWQSDLMKQEDDPQYDVLVRRMINLTNELYSDRENRPWWKPWPNPLPQHLYLDSPEGIEQQYLREDDFDYIEEELAEDEPFVLCPAIYEWQYGERNDWEPLEWDKRAMRAVVGIIDDPGNALLHILKVDLTRGNYVVFGAAGYGKSAFLRSLLTFLLATHSPRDIHLYILDFGNRALKIFEEMPHTGAWILSHEVERVERLLRNLDQTIEERKELLSEANVENLYAYNVKYPDNPLPAWLVVIDNFADFKDNYEEYLDMFASLLRDGLSVGVHFVVTADQTSTVGKMFNLLPERITLRLADDSEYVTVVGRGARPVEEFPGRGLKRVERSPLELQVAMPVKVTDEDMDAGLDENQKLVDLLDKLSEAWQEDFRPPQIEVLAEKIPLDRLMDKHLANGYEGGTRALLGLNESDLEPQYIEFGQKPHFMVTGPPSSGKTTALYTAILSLARDYSPKDVAIVLIDYQGTLSYYGGERQLHDLPHMLQPVITEAAEFAELLKHLENEYLHLDRPPEHEIYVIIDNYDDIEELVGASSFGSDIRKQMGNLARRAGRSGLHFIICGMRMQLDDLSRPIAANRYGLSMDVESAGQAPFYANVPRSYTKMELPRGRGFLIYPGRMMLLQIAQPYEDEVTKMEAMDEQVTAIIAKYEDAHVQWRDWAVREDEESEEPDDGAAASDNGQPISAEPDEEFPYTAEQVADIRRALAETMGMDEESLKMIDDDGIIEMAERYNLLSEEE